MQKSSKTKIITIYLPQFHEIAENNEWWGQGFTEWTNVKRGKPFYPGHYQPRVPYNKDYYDLSTLETLEKHTRMAAAAGIYGFGFYHYYFSGRKLLEKPIEQYRDKSKENFKYCLIWANQSWARTWYRANEGTKVLLAQEYGQKEDWIRHFEYLKTFFSDSRYIKIDNKPLYVIYLPQDIACRKEMFDVWNKMAIESGWDGVYIVAMNTGWGVDRSYNLYQAYMNFEPIHTMYTDVSLRCNIQKWKASHINKMRKDKCLNNYIYAQNIYSYDWVCKQIEKGNVVHSKTKTMFGLAAGWDNTSRKDEAGSIIRNTTPKRFGKHVKRMLELSEKAGNEFLFLNAWNEWSEGAYIEPDERWGSAFLDELKGTVENYEKRENSNMGCR